MLQMKDSTLDKWRQLPKVRKHVGAAGLHMSHLWEWTLSYRTPCPLSESASSQALQCESVQATMVKGNRSKLEASLLVQSRSLAKWSCWSQIPIPQKIVGSNKLLSSLQQMLDGFRKADPPTTKQLPVEAVISEFLVQLGLSPEARELDCAIGDFTMIAFYNLLRIGEYTTKGTCNNSKQTEEFKMGGITFFAKDKQGNLCCLPRDATEDLIAVADGATMKLDNQKNGWKGVCVYQESNGDPLNCPIRALGRRYLHIRTYEATKKTMILAYFNEGRRYDVTSEHVSSALKLAVGALEYPTFKGIPIERVNTHSLRSGGTNPLALAGYSDTQIQKMGHW
jgi:hypothetical protein